ncbi:hypothetical protein BH23ACT8_BH23ACT8_12860 [soil metagenome]
MTRLAVALWPPPEVVRVLSALDRPAIAGVRWSTPEQWMVKVRALGHVDERLVPALRAALREGLDGAPATRCRLGPATIRLGGQWLGVPVEGLDELGRAAFEATEHLVGVTHPQPFRADIVLARGRAPADLAGQTVRADWIARSIALVADRSSPRGPRFDEFARLPLGG